MTFYRYEKPHNEAWVIRTYCHEAGHYIDTRIATETRRFSEGLEWKSAIRKDKKVCGKKSPTSYGENDYCEDFAESIAEYCKDENSFGALFPNRKAILDRILK